MSDNNSRINETTGQVVDALGGHMEDDSPGAVNSATSVNDAIWAEFSDAVHKYHHKPDLQAARGVYAAVAAHRLLGVPVWPMLIAPPGSGKGVAVDPLHGLDKVHMIDEVTPKAFLSGQMPDPTKPATQSASLLHRIGSDGILVISDFSTMLSSQADERSKIMSQLRRLFDGQFRREFGTAEKLEEREWTGRLTVVAAVTPDIDRHRSSIQALGERFVPVRWARAAGTEAALAAMNQDIAEKKATLKALVHKLFAAIPSVEPVVPAPLQEQIAALAEFTVCARTDVARDPREKERVLYIPEAESATRLAQQLAQLSKGAALLSGRDVVTPDDYRLVRRAAMDCLPTLRRHVVDAFLGDGELNTAVIKPTAFSYLADDLELLGMFDRNWFSDKAVDLLTQAGFQVPPRPARNRWRD
jgi:hypothetical protein